ncbi:MAG: phosphoadenylyl-sulfate reductase [Telmatospirillum sp.]|nr:phosphoadenylyl-sulfate reductase [Telmatospirillum sp.]
MSPDVLGRVRHLRHAFGHLDGRDVLEAVVRTFPGKVAVTSSFGAEAAVLLDLVAQVDPTLPVIVLDTGALFDETLIYCRALTLRLGLSDVRMVHPEPADAAAAEELWLTDADRCCHLRKVLPLRRAVEGFEVLVDGRKRFHGGGREGISTIEVDLDGRIKVSPLARWSQPEIDDAFRLRDLPRHPLVADGYRSIGCWPCSRPVGADEPVRAGRWAGAAKTECGIHRVSKAL